MAAPRAHRFAIALGFLVLACGGEVADDADVPAAAPAAAPAPAGLSMADVAGAWTVEVMPENADTTILTFEMTAAADGTWMMMFPGRTDHVVMQATASGDSIITRAGPYPSALRDDVNVTTTGVMRLQNGMLVGTTTARYQGATADSVVVLRTRATRNQ